MLLRVANKIITIYGFLQDTVATEPNELYMGCTSKLPLAELAELCQAE